MCDRRKLIGKSPIGVCLIGECLGTLFLANQPLPLGILLPRSEFVLKLCENVGIRRFLGDLRRLRRFRFVKTTTSFHASDFRISIFDVFNRTPQVQNPMTFLDDLSIASIALLALRLTVVTLVTLTIALTDFASVMLSLFTPPFLHR